MWFRFAGWNLLFSPSRLSVPTFIKCRGGDLPHHLRFVLTTRGRGQDLLSCVFVYMTQATLDKVDTKTSLRCFIRPRLWQLFFEGPWLAVMGQSFIMFSFKSNGQTESVNQVLEKRLQCLPSSNTSCWTEHLVMSIMLKGIVPLIPLSLLLNARPSGFRLQTFYAFWFQPFPSITLETGGYMLRLDFGWTIKCCLILQYIDLCSRN